MSLLGGCSRTRYHQTLVLALSSLLAWHLGSLLAQVVHTLSTAPAADEAPHTAVTKLLTVPIPRKQKCNSWSSCPADSFPFNIISGGGLKKPPYLCFDDHIMIGKSKSSWGRGMNIAAVNASSGKPIGISSFDMWQGDNSAAMVKFIQGIPNGSLVLMATYDDGSTKLKPMAKMEVKKLGSSLIDKIAFRSSWVFLGSKGVALPNHLTRERMVHNSPSTNIYGGWPRETQIEGCVPG